jgi:ABC transporter substrate binding protein
MDVGTSRPSALAVLRLITSSNFAAWSQFAEGDYDRLPALASELVTLKVDTIVTHSIHCATRDAEQATYDRRKASCGSRCPHGLCSGPIGKSTGTPGARAAKQATSTIPIVVTAAADLVYSGLVPSIARPGGNLTGLTFFFAEIWIDDSNILSFLVPESAQAP